MNRATGFHFFSVPATMGHYHWISCATNSDEAFGHAICLFFTCQPCLFFVIENVLMCFSYTWFLAWVTPFSCFRPSSPKRSRLCLVSWAVRRRSSAQQPGTSDRHPLDALLWLSVRAWELYHVLHSSPIIEYYYRRRPGTIRPKCSFIETISSSENAFRKKWRAANVLTLSKLEGVLK